MGAHPLQGQKWRTMRVTSLEMPEQTMCVSCLRYGYVACVCSAHSALPAAPADVCQSWLLCTHAVACSTHPLECMLLALIAFSMPCLCHHASVLLMLPCHPACRSAAATALPRPASPRAPILATRQMGWRTCRPCPGTQVPLLCLSAPAALIGTTHALHARQEALSRS